MQAAPAMQFIPHSCSSTACVAWGCSELSSLYLFFSYTSGLMFWVPHYLSSLYQLSSYSTALMGWESFLYHIHITFPVTLIHWWGKDSNFYPAQLPCIVTPLGDMKGSSLLLLYPLQPNWWSGASLAHVVYFSFLVIIPPLHCWCMSPVGSIFNPAQVTTKLMCSPPPSLPCSYTMLHPALVLRVRWSSRFPFTSPANFYHYTDDAGLFFSAPFLLPLHLTLLIT